MAKKKILQVDEVKVEESVLATQDETNNALLRENEELREQLAELNNGGKPVVTKALPGVPPDIFKVKGQKYRFNMPFFILPKMGKVTALEALLDDELHTCLGGLTIKEYLAKTPSRVVSLVQ